MESVWASVVRDAFLPAGRPEGTGWKTVYEMMAQFGLTYSRAVRLGRGMEREKRMYEGRVTSFYRPR